jgi:tRNA modification GTPase
MLNSHDTIAAPATATGPAALALIRLSGSRALNIASNIFVPRHPRKSIFQVPSHTIHFGAIYEGNELVDEVLLSVFRKPQSFTGEDVVEISCHGSPYIVQRILNLLIRKGARMATPGEFTLRAFLNGKMDLAQAEAVADLIASSSACSHLIAMNQMKGKLSDEIRQLREALIGFASLLELEMDFAEEDVEFADRKQLLHTASHIRERIERLMNSFETGEAIRQGVPVVIAGRPNAGKSTLLNKLLQEERALVSPLPGTTRDTIEEDILIHGILFRLIDTAGLRPATDTIEQAGIERARKQISKARIVIYLFDIAELNPSEVQNDLNELQQYSLADHPFSVLTCANKIDLVDEDRIRLFESSGCLLLSLKEEVGLEALKDKLTEPFIHSMQEAGHAMITNARHYQALKNAAESLTAVIEGLKAHRSHDLIATDLRHVLTYLGEITSPVAPDELLDNIFSRFCIGK